VRIACARCARRGARCGAGRHVQDATAAAVRPVASPGAALTAACLAFAEPGGAAHAGSACCVGLHAVRQPVPRQRLLDRQP
jgi:hypothetical protein